MKPLSKIKKKQAGMVYKELQREISDGSVADKDLGLGQLKKDKGVQAGKTE